MESFVRSLSVNPNRPCFFMQYGETFIMLDCAMDLRPCLKFLPVTQVFTAGLAQIKRWDHGNSFLYSTDDDILENEGHLLINGAPEFEVPDFQQVDPADLHYILISNFSQIFALPYLINERNFNGKIFATAPTIQLAKDVFQDLSSYLATYSTSLKAEKWKVKEVLQLLPPALQSTRPHLWKSLYSMEALEMALKKVEVINFRQTVPLENSLVITAYSSGFAMGSCNWTIQSPEEKICYLADSSTLNTHMSPIDLEDLKHADVMIVSALNMDPARSLGDSLERLAKTIMDTLKDGGNVLIPFSSADLLIDLLEYLYLYMDQLPTNVPINVISGTARSMLSLSQVFSEWLNKDYRDKAYIPEEPFVHGEMIRNSRLQIFPSVDGKFSETFKSPCIVFCSHYSLRFGPAVHLMSQWKSSHKNSVIFTDPEFHFEEVLAPYRPLAMKVAYCPMDTRLTPSQLSKVVATTEPKTLIIHERYLSPYDASSETADQIVRCPPSTKICTFTEKVDVPLPVHYRWIDTVASAAFLSDIPMSDVSVPTNQSVPFENVPVENSKKILVGRIYGHLRTLDNQYIIEATKIAKTVPTQISPKYPTLSFEKPDVWKLARYLKREGFCDVVLETGEGDNATTKLVSPQFHFTITITHSSTSVTTVQPTMETRKKLKRVMEILRAPKEPLVAGVQLEDPSVGDLLPAAEGLMEIISTGPDSVVESKLIK